MEAEKSRVFIKITKTKTLAAYGQIVDVLFAGNKFPISIEPTELPEGVAKDVNFDPKEPPQLREQNANEAMDNPYGYMGDGKELPAGATEKSLKDSLGPLSEKLADVDNLKEGDKVCVYPLITKCTHISCCGDCNTVYGVGKAPNLCSDYDF